MRFDVGQAASLHPVPTAGTKESMTTGRDDDRSGGERERRSWREIDRRRDGTHREEPGPRGAADRARADAASKRYRRELEKRFATRKGGPEGERLAKSMRAAHGTPELAGACRAYREALGAPVEAALISLFLDSGDSELVGLGLESLRSALRDGTVSGSAGLKTQLRMLAQDTDDAIAEAAEGLLEAQ